MMLSKQLGLPTCNSYKLIRNSCRRPPGLTDMFPRSSKTHGRVRYEDMESVVYRAGEWAANQPHVTLVNVHTMLFRRRGKMTEGSFHSYGVLVVSGKFYGSSEIAEPEGVKLALKAGRRVSAW